MITGRFATRILIILGLGAAGLAAIVVLGISSARGQSPRAHAARHKGPDRCIVPGFKKPLGKLWRPDMAAALSYAHSRTGDIAFAVRTDRLFYAYRRDHQEWSASVLKAMLLVAYVNQHSVANRPLNSYDKSLLYPMITRSDNNAATTVDHIVGNAGLDRVARRARMNRFVAVSYPWGESRITASDQTKFFLHIDRFTVRRHRRYVMHLLASITPSQRWGIGEVAPRGWKLYFKGGWGSGTGLIDHQVALLTRGCARLSVAVLSMYDGSHDYGKATLKGMFQRLLKGLPKPRRRHHRVGREPGRLLNR